VALTLARCRCGSSAPHQVDWDGWCAGDLGRCQLHQAAFPSSFGLGTSQYPRRGCQRPPSGWPLGDVEAQEEPTGQACQLKSN
jgi:hypothetical protein